MVDSMSIRSSRIVHAREILAERDILHVSVLLGQAIGRPEPDSLAEIRSDST